MEVGWYLNHSAQPNMRIESYQDGQEEDCLLYVINYHIIRDIKAGEEVLIDYNDLDEPEALKEDFYKM